MGSAAPRPVVDGFTVVQCPRARDGIGNALRHAYDRENTLPGDLSSLLRQIDEHDLTRR